MQNQLKFFEFLFTEIIISYFFQLMNTFVRKVKIYFLNFNKFC